LSDLLDYQTCSDLKDCKILMEILEETTQDEYGGRILETSLKFQTFGFQLTLGGEKIKILR